MSSVTANIVSFVYLVSRRLNGRCSKLILIIAGFWFLVTGFVTGQAVGDYRTTGNADFVSALYWERYNGSWAPAASAPGVADGVITIRSGDIATLTVSKTLNQLVVASGGVLSINSGQTLTLSNIAGTELDVNGTVVNSGNITINAGATINFNAGSVYDHSQDGGTIPIASWNIASTCLISGITASTTLAGLNQTFGNLTWDCPGETDNLYMEANVTVAGDFRVLHTGLVDPTNHALRMSNTSTGYTLTVNGNVVIDNDATFKMNNSTGSCVMNVAGDFTLNSACYFCIVTGDASSTLSVSGNVNITGGYLSMQEEASQPGILNVKGNLTLSGSGAIDETASGVGEINFNGSGTQIYSKTGGTITNTINFNVLNGSILNVGTSLIDGSDGSFNLNSGAGLITAHAQGISITSGTGSIQVAGSKIFSSGADYTYNGVSAQVTGNALPGSIHNFALNNPAGITSVSYTHLTLPTILRV